MPITARSTTHVRQLCINNHTNEIVISTLLRGTASMAMPPGDPDVCRLPACATCGVVESLRIDQADWPPARQNTLAGRRRSAALWLVRKLAKDDQWTSPGLKALRAAETDPPDAAPDPAGAAFEPV